MGLATAYAGLTGMFEKEVAELLIKISLHARVSYLPAALECNKYYTSIKNKQTNILGVT